MEEVGCSSSRSSRSPCSSTSRTASTTPPNAIATGISTRALNPRFAVLFAAVLNFAGAFVSLEVAATIASGIVDPEAITLEVVLAGLVGAIAWNLTTWYLGLPSSSSHALIGGTLGAAVAATGFAVIQWDGIINKVLIPSLAAPFLGMLGAALFVTAIVWIVARRSPGIVHRVFRRFQIVSSGFLAFTHGTNDAQKTMGIITLALIASGHLSGETFDVPIWVIISAATAIALGTYAGGWRIIRTLGQRIAKIDPVSGLLGRGVDEPDALLHRPLRVPGLDDAHDLRIRPRGRGDEAALRGALGRRRQHPHRLGHDHPLRRARGGAHAGNHPDSRRRVDRLSARRPDRDHGLRRARAPDEGGLASDTAGPGRLSCAPIPLRGIMKA